MANSFEDVGKICPIRVAIKRGAHLFDIVPACVAELRELDPSGAKHLTMTFNWNGVRIAVDVSSTPLEAFAQYFKAQNIGWTEVDSVRSDEPVSAEVLAAYDEERARVYPTKEFMPTSHFFDNR